MIYKINLDRELIEQAEDKGLNINSICTDAILEEINSKSETSDINAFFESAEWKKDYAKRIRDDLGKAVPIVKLIDTRYNLKVTATQLIKKARELQGPTLPKKKIKGVIKR